MAERLGECKNYLLCKCIPQRISVMIFCMFGTLIFNGFWSTMDRLVQGNRQIADVESNSSQEIRATLESQANNMGFDEVSMLHLVFYGAYVTMLLPAGILTDKFGGKMPYLSAIVMTSTISLGMPIIVRYFSWSMLYTFTMILGVSQAFSNPAMGVIVAHWTPCSQRGTLGGFIFGAKPFGMSIAYIISRLSTQYDYQWFSLNVFWGAAGIVWSVLFAVTVYDTPQQNPWVSEKEKEMLDMEVPRGKLHSLPPLGKIFKSRGIWALMITQMGHNASMFILTLPMLTYSWWYYKIQDYRGYKRISTEIDCLIILFSFLGLWLTSASTGALGDHGITMLRWNIRATRVIPTYIAFLVPNTFLIMTVVIPYDEHMTTVLYILAATMKGPFFGSLQINYLDITANFCGLVISLTCLAGEVGRIVSFAWVTTAKTIDWSILFWTLIAIGFLSILPCAFLIEWERAKWDLTGSELAIYLQRKQRVSFNIKPK